MTAFGSCRIALRVLDFDFNRTSENSTGCVDFFNCDHHAITPIDAGRCTAAGQLQRCEKVYRFTRRRGGRLSMRVVAVLRVLRWLCWRGAWVAAGGCVAAAVWGRRGGAAAGVAQAVKTRTRRSKPAA